jgi:hypothetical protein
MARGIAVSRWEDMAEKSYERVSISGVLLK